LSVDNTLSKSNIFTFTTPGITIELTIAILEPYKQENTIVKSARTAKDYE
jgi:hypothetical protein